MSPAFVIDFQERKRHVRHYLAVVQDTERLVLLGATATVNERRLLTLRAGTFLLLYNLVEASTRNAIEAVHDEIATKNTEFENLAKPLRHEMVRRFKQVAKPETHQAMKNLPAAFVSVALDQGVSLSGNVDAKFIRELSEVYGFSVETDKTATWGGADLLNIKSNRNALAHGRKTFEEVGRDYTGRDLLLVTRRTFAYMGAILDNIVDYIASKDYLDKTAPTKKETKMSAIPLYHKRRRYGYKSHLR